VSRILVETLKAMDPRYPEPPPLDDPGETAPLRSRPK